MPDILRASGTTPDLWTNNLFSLTICSRSPDLNIFGQPKMAILPMLEDSYTTPAYNNPNLLNGITLQPLKEIYPTPSQLPSYPVANVVNSNLWGATPTQSVPWPLAFRQEVGLWNAGVIASGLGSVWRVCFSSGGCHFCWMNGLMLAHYLAGTNAMGQAITWPAFPGPGSSTLNTGFSGKYTPRQIDSIVAQVLSYGSKTISPDYPYSSDASGAEGYFLPGFRGRAAITTPFLFPGWLTGQLVNGVGRTPSTTSILMQFTTQGSNLAAPTDPSYIPPETTLDIWFESWLPAAYLGGNNVIPPELTGWVFPITMGTSYYGNPSLNVADEAATLGQAPQLPSPLPKASLDSAGNINSYWGNQLLTNNQGIDFQGNTSTRDDPDQVLAKLYHDPWALNISSATYRGAGTSDNSPYFASPFLMPPLQGATPPQDWAPGELRCVSGGYGSSCPMPMQTTANGSTLQIGGGMTLNIDLAENDANADIVPLESIRGQDVIYLDGENWGSPSGVPGYPTVRDRAIASVIPISFGMPIPPAGDGSDPVNIKYVLARVADPLVNKFPGDWMVTVSDSPPSSTMETNAYGAQYNSYSEYDSGFHTNLASTINGIQGDPDSYWLPQADCGISSDLADVAQQTLIPRSARFPNIGYLQYLRTGIIPDDETLPYQPQPGQAYSQYQHGTPFRLLSYAPSTEVANQETTRTASSPLGISQPYPDWAMLDLLYVPSILAPYAGPYGYYDTSKPPAWQGYGNPGVLANYSTGGGSTPGRINPNGMVIYTTNALIPQPDVFRTLPMQAVLHGLMVNQTLVPNGIDATAPNFNPNPGFTGGTTVDDSTLSQALANYISAHGPFCLPAEICNVPEIAALRPSVNATRNDLVRQIMGALTTQSNVFFRLDHRPDDHEKSGEHRLRDL